MATQPIIKAVRALQDFTYSPTVGRIDVLYEQEIGGVLHTWIKSTLTCMAANGAVITEERKLPYSTAMLKAVSEVRLTGEIVIAPEALEAMYNVHGLTLKDEDGNWLSLNPPNNAPTP